MAKKLTETGYKRIDVRKVHKDGHTSELLLYMSTKRDNSMFGVSFLATCPEHDYRAEGKDLGKLTDEGIAAVESRMVITWTRYLHVTMKAPHAKIGGRVKRSFHGSRAGWIDMNMMFDVSVVECSEVNGKRQHRWLEGDGSQKEQGRFHERVCDGWPKEYEEAQDDERHHHSIAWIEPQRAAALILDTPTNREALERIETAMLTLGHQLTKLLSPVRIARSLTAVLASPAGMPLLSAPASPVGPSPAVKRKGARP